MKSKNKFFLFIIIVIIAIIGYYYIIPLFTSSDKNIENEVPELALNSNDLISAYISNEEKSDELYVGKIIEVTGSIKEITFLNDRNTIILESKNKKFGVICDLNPNQKEKIKELKKHQKIKVKGICKGFLKDVILLNCAIEIITNE